MKSKSFLSILFLLIFIFSSTIFAVAVPSPTDYIPYELTAKQMQTDELHPYGSALLTFKIDNLPGDTGISTLTWYVNIEKNLGDGEWMGVSAIPTVDFIDQHTIGTNQYSYEQLWLETENWTGNLAISYRVYVSLEDLIGSGGGNSAYSNIASIGLKSSPWAVAELKSALDLGLIPDSLLSADLTKPITREEFCEMAVLLYESITLTKSTPTSPNPFNDTSNPQILKAYNIGVTNGISATTFEPKTLINREQCAAMLYRDIKAMRPAGDYVITDVKDFPDQKDVSSWANEATKYMSKLGIIKGDTSSGNFMPKAITTAQKATTYGMATREAAILMSVRAYEKLK